MLRRSDITLSSLSRAKCLLMLALE